jgi:hypothetical protein
MKRNDKILQEAFFKKSSYADKLKRKLPQYEPKDKNSVDQPGFGAILDPDTRGVTDADEAKKRLTGAFGAVIGSNTVRSIASRSVKSFPIVISDNIEPETSVMLKRLFEEQYAEYINLLISNQVIDISAYQSGDTGNIAIQALDTISGTEFGSKKIARKSTSGELSAVDFFQNISAYNLIRQETTEYKTGVPLLDALLEDAIILPEQEAKIIVEFITTYPEELDILNEDLTLRDKKTTTVTNQYEYTTLSDFLKNKDSLKKSDAEAREAIFNLAKDKRLSSTDIVVDPAKIKEALDTTVAEMLLHPKNELLKEKFEKATFLLQSNRISGLEYIEYLAMRLGLPVSRKTRGDLVTGFPEDQVIDPEFTSTIINSKDANRIRNNQRIVGRALPNIFKTALEDILEATATLAATGAASAGAFFGGTTLAAASSIALPAAVVAFGPAGLAILGGLAGFFIFRAVVGGQGLSSKIEKILSKIFPRLTAAIKLKKFRKSAIMGWERVEALIDNMDAQQQSLRKALENRKAEELEPLKDPSSPGEFKSYGEKIDEPLSESELKVFFKKYQKELEAMMKRNDVSASSNEYREPVFFFLNEDNKETLSSIGEILEEDVLNSEDYYSDLLSEAIIQTKIPVELTTTYEYDTKSKAKIRVAPKFGAAATYAYGSVEYDKRELKDRKYNTPLMLTIKFKERYADGTYADNELVAVIGILGVITRIPSEEMAYILKSSAEGQTIKGILKASSNDTNMISDLLGVTKLKKDIQNLPQSAEIWQDLEKVSRLAVANKLAGKRSDNIANAHLVFSQKEVDDVRADINVDYLKDKKLSSSLMKRYSAMSIMIANDASERLYIYDSPENISWDVIPYSAIRNKDTGDQLVSALNTMRRMG